jgi:alginate O-acetyltransferase complex protein AlgI
MALSSPAYLLFVAAVWIAVRILRGARPRKLALLAASCLFYALLDLRALVLLILLGGLTFGLGAAVGRGRRAGVPLAAGIAAALGVLAFFKFSDVWLSVFRPIFPAVGGWMLPVGISFFTFQCISYLIDIRRRRIEPVRDWLDFGLYLAFFPKIVAGPIVRPTDFFRMLDRGVSPGEREDLPEISALFLRGLFKKVVIADALAGLAGVGFQVAAANSGFSPAPVYWRSLYLFAFQIYADFSGYTDIARASGRLLGIPLPENFNRPYAACSITEFWNRWHMSLTQWFREYVFFPMNRALLPFRRIVPQPAIQAGTTIGTMLLIGLWHGAGMPYLSWGFWNGLLLSLDKFRKTGPARRWTRALAVLGVFHLTAAGWILFRSESLAAAGRFFAGLFAGGQWFLIPECALPVAASAAAVFVADALGIESLPPALRSSGFLKRVLLTAPVVMIVSLWLLNWATGGGGQPFYYQNF